MACDGAKKPLLAGLVNPTAQIDQIVAPRRRRFRRSKSAPLAAEINGEDSLPRSESIIGNLHPSLWKVAIFLVFYFGIGMVCFYVFRHQMNGKKTNAILDAVYFCIVTMTTVGYGDLVPNSMATKLLACVFVFSGTVLVGFILCKAADYLVEKQELLLVKALHLHKKVGPVGMLKEMETNRVRYKCYVVLTFLLVLIISGTSFLVLVEKLDIVDAFYCVCATITTLGYGDKSFSTEAGRVFAIFWILAGTLCLTQFFLSVAELNTENRQRALVKWVLTKRVTNEDLEAADLDDDGVVGAAEFILYKLKEMGKINQEDILLVMDEFENLDVDQSGTLSPSDLMLAQSTQIGR